MKKGEERALFLQFDPMQKPEKRVLLTHRSDGCRRDQKGLLEPST